MRNIILQIDYISRFSKENLINLITKFLLIGILACLRDFSILFTTITLNFLENRNDIIIKRISLGLLKKNICLEILI